MRYKKGLTALLLASAAALSLTNLTPASSEGTDENLAITEGASFFTDEADQGNIDASGLEKSESEMPSENNSATFEEEIPEIILSEDEGEVGMETTEEFDIQLSSDNEEIEDQDVLEGEAISLECTCLYTGDEAYIHSWDCKVFWDSFMEKCTCGEIQQKVTSHAFDCEAFQTALSEVCSCETDMNIFSMHDECEVIRRIHKELCTCGKDYTSVDAILDSHDADNAAVKYLMEWAKYCNQPELLWTNSDAAGDSSKSPKIHKVNTNTIEDKNYAFVAKFGGTPTIYNSSNIPTYTNSKYSTSAVHFKTSGFTSGKKVYAVYPNVGKYDGKMLDLKLTLSDPLRTYTGHSTYTVPTVGFFTNKIGICQYVTHDVAAKFEFLQHGTNTVVAVKGHITIKDIDGGYQNYGSGFRAYENHGVDKINILSGGDHLITSYKKTSAGNYYSLIKGKNSNDQGGSDIAETDKKGWAVIYFNGTFSIRTELGDDFDATSGHGNRHAGVIFESTVIGTYTLDAPKKRCGPKDSIYANMQWHNATDATKPEGERPLDTEPGGEYAYGIEHTIYPMTYTSYVLTDDLDTCVSYVAGSGKVVDSAGNNLTGKFSFNYNTETHVLTVSPQNLTVLDYKTTLYYTFNVTLADRETILNHGHQENTTYYYVKNTASVNVNGTKLDTGITWFRGIPELPRGNITVTKKIKEADIVWAHGNPTFFFTVFGKDESGQVHTYKDFVEFQNKNYAVFGEYAVLSVTFKNIPIGTYAVGEEETLRYKYQDIGENSSNVTVSRENGTAAVVLSEKDTEAQVTYWNEKSRYDGLSHCDVVKNITDIQW